MPSVEERLATLEAQTKAVRDDLQEIKLLLEGLRPFQLDASRVQQWQMTVDASIVQLGVRHDQVDHRVSALEMWRSYLLGGMTVILFLGTSGLAMAIMSSLSK